MRGYGIKVDQHNAQHIIRLLKKMELRDRAFEIIRRNGHLVIPIKRDLSIAELTEISGSSSRAKVVEEEFMTSSQRPRDLREAIGRALPSDIADQLPRSYDVVGDIGILELNDELQAFSKIIANGLMNLNPHLRLVVREVEKTSGQYRTRGIEVIAGSGSTETVHFEFSSKFHLDVASVYFNPRLSHERMRVASQVMGGEVVVDMFAGVGTYSILIAKMQSRARVFSIDLNPAAYKYLQENIFVNKVADKVTPLLGDSREVASKLPGIADRVIMNLPSDSQTFLGAAAKFLRKSGGILHFYCFGSRSEELQNLSDSFQDEIESYGRRVASFSFLQAIKEVAPNRVQVALDAIIL